MDYESKEFYSKEAIKYAIIFDDLALKSTTDQDRWLFRRTAKLLRSLGSRIKDFDDGETTGISQEQA